MVQLRLLGGVDALGDAGDPVDVGPAKCQLVLAALALEPGVAVPVGRLVELVWGEDAPRTAERTLQSYVARIRRGLGATSIVRSGAAYRLDLDPERVDVARFERHLDAGNVAAALAEWAGTPLAGLDAPGLVPAVDRLTERWLAATETDLAARVERDPASAVGTLTELTATHPFREGLWALLMTALYRADRQADALAAYGRARRVLVDELGVEPGPRLRELEALVLGQNRELAGTLAGPPAPASTGVLTAQSGPPVDPARPDAARPAGRTRSTSLPRQVATIVGRDRLVADVRAAIGRDRLVTLTGPGGVGKTTVATAVAHATLSDEQDVRFVDLSVVSTNRDVARAVLDTLGASEQPGPDLLGSAAEAINALGPVLLVVDNCEQVIDGTATFAIAVLDRCPDAGLLVTSREPIGLTDERTLEVPPLDPGGSAVELFLARAASPVGENGSHASVVELCRRLDGVPLAIELAAARTRTLTPAQLLERLGRDLRVLDAGLRGRPARHRTLRAAVEWSHDLLEDDERVVFQRLSVFPATFDLRAAEAVAADDRLSSLDVDDLLDRLVRQSMVSVRADGIGMRFRMLAPMRQLAADHLAAQGRAEEVARRHTAWVLTEVRSAGALLEGWDEVRGEARIRQLWPDLRAAVDRATAAGDGRLLRDLVEPVAAEVLLRSGSEVGGWAERVLELADGDEELLVFGLMWAARLHLRHRDPDGYRRLLRRYGEPDHPIVRHAGALATEDNERLVLLCREAAEWLRSKGRTYLAAMHEVGIGRALLSLGRVEEHDEVVSELVERFRVTGPPTLLHWTLGMLGYSKLRQGQREEADQLFAESAEVEVPPGTHSRSGPVAARMAARSGERGRAFEILRDHAAELLERRDLYEARLLCVEVVNLLVGAGRPEDAARLLGYLEATGLLDNPAFAALVEDSTALIERSVPTHATLRAAGTHLDDPAALTLIHALAGLSVGGLLSVEGDRSE
ncbi:MAG: BTAD domain-containing putative transcriptional regulator [Actinomycetota bacterium]|nr:BTAD domain-containing putative transcriptional regulator [Actinomycetota bacterium]